MRDPRKDKMLAAIAAVANKEPQLASVYSATDAGNIIEAVLKGGAPYDLTPLAAHLQIRGAPSGAIARAVERAAGIARAASGNTDVHTSTDVSTATRTRVRLLIDELVSAIERNPDAKQALDAERVREFVLSERKDQPVGAPYDLGNLYRGFIDGGVPERTTARILLSVKLRESLLAIPLVLPPALASLSQEEVQVMLDENRTDAPIGPGTQGHAPAGLHYVRPAEVSLGQKVAGVSPRAIAIAAAAVIAVVGGLVGASVMTEQERAISVPKVVEMGEMDLPCVSMRESRSFLVCEVESEAWTQLNENEQTIRMRITGTKAKALGLSGVKLAVLDQAAQATKQP